MNIHEAIEIVDNMVKCINALSEDTYIGGDELEAIDVLCRVAKQYMRDNECGYRGM